MTEFFVPVTVIVKPPFAVVVVVETVSTDVPVPPEVNVTLLGLRAIWGPAGTSGEMVAERLIVPARPFKLVRVIVEVAELLALMVKESGFAVIWKFGGVAGVAAKAEKLGPSAAKPAVIWAARKIVSMATLAFMVEGLGAFNPL